MAATSGHYLAALAAEPQPILPRRSGQRGTFNHWVSVCAAACRRVGRGGVCGRLVDWRTRSAILGAAFCVGWRHIFISRFLVQRSDGGDPAVGKRGPGKASASARDIAAGICFQLCCVPFHTEHHHSGAAVAGVVPRPGIRGRSDDDIAAARVPVFHLRHHVMDVLPPRLARGPNGEQAATTRGDCVGDNRIRAAGSNAESYFQFALLSQLGASEGEPEEKFVAQKRLGAICAS